MVEVRYKIYRADGYVRQISELKYWLGQLDFDTWGAPIDRGFVLDYLVYNMQFKNPDDAVAFKIKFGSEWPLGRKE